MRICFNNNQIKSDFVCSIHLESLIKHSVKLFSIFLFSTLNFLHWLLNMKFSTLTFRRWLFDVDFPTLTFLYWLFDVKFSTLTFLYWLFDTDAKKRKEQFFLNEEERYWSCQLRRGVFSNQLWPLWELVVFTQNNSITKFLSTYY